MSRPRGNGEGSVYEEGLRSTPTGRWVAQVVVDGTKRRSFAKSEAEAKRKLRAMLRDLDGQRVVSDGNLTVGELLDRWKQRGLPSRKLSAQGVASHEWAVRTLTEMLGSRRVRTLTPDHVEKAFDVKAADGAARATLVKLRTTLNLALTWSERRGLVARNIAGLVEIPATARPTRPGRTMTASEAARFVEAAREMPLGAMWLCLLYLGLRPGEGMGLSWDDIDLDGGTIHVCRAVKRVHGRSVVGTTKTPHSVRSLSAPEPVIAVLRAHRKAQSRARLAAGALWSNPEDLVFTTTTGGPIEPWTVRHEFNDIITAAELGDGWTPNMLRHTAASLMSHAGLPIETVADQLGHRDTRMASRHYRHRVQPTVNGASAMETLLTAESATG